MYVYWGVGPPPHMEVDQGRWRSTAGHGAPPPAICYNRMNLVSKDIDSKGISDQDIVFWLTTFIIEIFVILNNIH